MYTDEPKHYDQSRLKWILLIIALLCMVLRRAGRYGPKKLSRYFFFISVDIDDYHDICQIFIFLSLKADFCN